MKRETTHFPIYLQVVLLLLAVLVLYAGSLPYPLVFDDFSFFSSPEKLAKYGENYFNLNSRWLSYVTLTWTIKWFGMDLFWLRLGNVLLHAANAVALLFLLRRLFQVTLADKDSFSTAALAWFAFFGALFFALHPVAVYGVTYVIQRSTLMATLFVLLMLRVYLEGLLRGGWYWMLAAVLCYFAALYSKEHSIMAPGAALALTLLVRRPSAALLRQLVPYVILLGVAAAIVIYFVSAKRYLGMAYEPRALEMLGGLARSHGLSELSNPYLLSVLTQSWLFFKYLGLWLIPNPAWMSVDMREPFALSLFGWHTLGVLAFLGYFCGAVWLLLKQGRLGLLGFALLFPWLLFLTEFSTVRVQEPFVLYRSYMWLPGLFAALPVVYGWLVPKQIDLGRTGIVVLGVIALVLVPLTLNRLNTFSSALLLWDDAEKLVRDNPNAYGIERIYANRGNKLFQLKRFEEATADYTKALAAHPNDELVYGSRAKAYYFLGKYQESLNDYDRAIALMPDNKRYYYDRALTHRALGNLPAAQEDLQKSCALGGVCP